MTAFSIKLSSRVNKNRDSCFWVTVRKKSQIRKCLLNKSMPLWNRLENDTPKIGPMIKKERNIIVNIRVPLVYLRTIVQETRVCSRPYGQIYYPVASITLVWFLLHFALKLIGARFWVSAWIGWIGHGRFQRSKDW